MAWIEDFFENFYPDLIPYFCHNIDTPAETEKIKKYLGLDKSHSILDIPCGYGRHCIELTRQGYQVTGLEYTSSQIEMAQTAMDKSGIRFPIIQGDMRNVPFENEFDRAFNYFSSFGYFCREENEKTVEQFYKLLKPGGKFLLELTNRDWILANYISKDFMILENGDLVLTERNFDYRASYISSVVAVIYPDGGQTRTDFSIRLYSPHEILELFESRGFEILDLIDEQGGVLNSRSQRINLIARKPG